MSREEVMEQLEQLGWEPVANVTLYYSRKEKHLARTRGKDDEVRDEQPFKRLRRPESKEQDRAERRVQDAQHSVVGTRDDATAEEVRDACGTVSWNVSEGYELSSTKAAESNSKAGARRRKDRLRETSGTAASDGSTTKDCSEVQCNLKTMSGKQLSMDEYELTTSDVERTDLAEIGNAGQNALLSVCELLGGRTLQISRDTGCDLLTRERSSRAAGLLRDNGPTVCWFRVSCALWWRWNPSFVCAVVEMERQCRERKNISEVTQRTKEDEG